MHYWIHRVHGDLCNELGSKQTMFHAQYDALDLFEDLMRRAAALFAAYKVHDWASRRDWATAIPTPVEINDTGFCLSLLSASAAVVLWRDCTACWRRNFASMQRFFAVSSRLMRSCSRSSRSSTFSFNFSYLLCIISECVTQTAGGPASYITRFLLTFETAFDDKANNGMVPFMIDATVLTLRSILMSSLKSFWRTFV